MTSNSKRDKGDLVGCTLPLILVFVVWPLMVTPYLRMRMPGVQIAPSFFHNTITGVMLGVVPGAVGAFSG